MYQISNQWVLPILALPRYAKRAIVLVVDVSACVLATSLAYFLRLGEVVPLADAAGVPALISVGMAIPIFIATGLYRAIFRYSGLPALLTVTRAICVYGLLFASLFTALGVEGVPRTVGLIQPLLLLLFVGSSRALAHIWLGTQYASILKKANRPRVLVYGAGGVGRQLVDAMRGSVEMQIVGFLDDDDRLHGHVLNGQPIYAPSDLNRLIDSLNIRAVLLAMPSLSRRRRNEILSQLRAARVAVRTLPSVTDLVQGRVGISDLQELDVDDLLGREPVVPNRILLAKNSVGKVVLVTGAGGSIGSELCRQILAMNPAKLLLVEQSEFALYAMHQELEERVVAAKGLVSTVLVPLLASVQDGERMSQIMSTWHPDIVYHAAAYKHVPLVEHNPAVGLKNNVLGTLRVALAAVENRVSDFVLISTDKAVRPTNIMGASKRLAEMVLQSIAATTETTKLSMVRFGNVLGSSGSVVPKFRRQISSGGPVTVTHPEVTRYFMTIPEAAQLVIQAGAMAKGGDVFVLNMGDPVKIIELARRMIELSGFTLRDERDPEGGIAIEIIGLRPGEKLHEELLIGDDPQPTGHSAIMKASDDFLIWDELECKLNALEAALDIDDVGVIRSIVSDLVEGYLPSGDIVDWIYLEQDASSAE